MYHSNSSKNLVILLLYSSWTSLPVLSKAWFTLEIANEEDIVGGPSSAKISRKCWAALTPPKLTAEYETISVYYHHHLLQLISIIRQPRNLVVRHTGSGVSFIKMVQKIGSKCGKWCTKILLQRIICQKLKILICEPKRHYYTRSYFTDHENLLLMNCISRPFLRPLWSRFGEVP